MNGLSRFAAGAERFVTAAGRIAAWAGLALVLVTVFDVATRNLSQSSIAILRDFSAAQQRVFGSTQLQELEWHLHTVLFMFCLGWAYVRGAHVRIDLIRERLGARAQAWIEVIGIVLFLLPFSALVIWYGIDFAADAFAQHEGSASGGGLGNRWLIKSAIPIGMALLMLAGLAALVRRVSALARGSDGTE